MVASSQNGTATHGRHVRGSTLGATFALIEGNTGSSFPMSLIKKYPETSIRNEARSGATSLHLVVILAAVIEVVWSNTNRVHAVFLSASAFGVVCLVASSSSARPLSTATPPILTISTIVAAAILGIAGIREFCPPEFFVWLKHHATEGATRLSFEAVLALAAAALLKILKKAFWK